MAREHLSSRSNWQQESSTKGREAKVAFYRSLRQHFSTDMDDIDIERNPNDLSGIFGDGYGVKPDFRIYHKSSGKSIFVIIRRQQGGGNAHERACKFMMPGILNFAREIAKQPIRVIPFWWVFSEGIASTPRYQREILRWFHEIEEHVLLWKDVSDGSVPVNHFECHMRKLLQFT